MEPETGLGRWGADASEAARRRGARLFGVGFALIPVMEVEGRRGVLLELVGALTHAQLPDPSLRGVAELALFVALGWAAARIMRGFHDPRAQVVFWLAAVVVLVVYVVATGPTLVAFVAGAALVLALVELRGAAPTTPA